MSERAARTKAPASAGSRANQGLSRERVLQVAIDIGDSDSLESLTMRGLAADLGIGTMTLYSYFRNKNELLDGMADEILGSLVLPSTAGLDPAKAIRSIASALRDMMRAHPSVVRLFESRTTRSQRAMQGSYERVLQALVALGLDRADAVRAYGLLLVYVLGFSAYERPRAWGRDPSELDGADELRRQRRLFYEGLPKADFPVMVATSEVLVTLPSDEQFEWGLGVITHGIVGRIPSSQPEPEAVRDEKPRPPRSRHPRQTTP